MTLLHRHFALSEFERLVAVSDTSTPWSQDAYQSHSLGEVKPHAYIFIEDGQVTPFEYGFYPNNKDLDHDVELAPAFISELGAFLRLTGLHEYLGMRVHPGENVKTQKLEFTVARANIMINAEGTVRSFQIFSVFHIYLFALCRRARRFLLSWFYEQDGPKKVRCNCHSHCQVLKDGKHLTMSHVHT
jgi:hypothetical protein